MSPDRRLNILLADDDERFRERLSKALLERGYGVFPAANHATALGVAAFQRLDRAIVDLRMPGPSGLILVRDLLARQREMEIVVLTGYGSIATAVEAMRIGARDYLTKPCHADRILNAFEADADASRDEPPVSYEIPSLARLEHEHIERVLRECNGNVSQTARVLGLHRRTLQYKLAKFPVSR
jgi:two-component system, response regulator RegA